MPHMSNLNWLLMFSTLNILLILFISNMSLKTNHIFKQNKSKYNSNKKWPW